MKTAPLLIIIAALTACAAVDRPSDHIAQYIIDSCDINRVTALISIDDSVVLQAMMLRIQKQVRAAGHDVRFEPRGFVQPLCHVAWPVRGQ